MIKFCESFTKITLKLPKNSQKPLFKSNKLVINTTKCDLCLFLHKMCCQMVWKFCEICKILWVLHTCRKLWTEICEIRQIFKGDLIKFCGIFIKITLHLPQYSQKPLFKWKKLVINPTRCDLCLFLHKMCCKMVWKFCEIEKSYGNWLSDGPNSVRFYLTVWDMACMELASKRPNSVRLYLTVWDMACMIISEPKILISEIRLNLSEISLKLFRRIQMFWNLTESFCRIQTSFR